MDSECNIFHLMPTKSCIDLVLSNLNYMVILPVVVANVNLLEKGEKLENIKQSTMNICINMCVVQASLFESIGHVICDYDHLE